MRRVIRFLHVAVLVILCSIGALVSGLLLLEHLPLSAGHGLMAAVCGEGNEGGISNCEAVVHSRWGKILGMPTAFWGTVYFVSLALWFLFIGRPTYEGRCWYVLPLLATLLGAAGSVFFITMMYAQVGHRCAWCLIAHSANFLILVLTVLLRPRRMAPAAMDVTGAPMPAGRPPARPHPSIRLALAVMLLAGLTSVCLAQSVLMARAWVRNETTRAVAQVMYGLYQDDPARVMEVRADDPQKTAGDDQLHVQTVVFGDFACGHCRRLAEALDREYNPLFDNHLQIVFKHYPLCKECNPHVERQADSHSCRAARAVEAARLQGGNEAFWSAHDLLFEKARAKLLAELDYGELARELELDPDRFIRDMESEQVADRIREDIDLGRSLGVNATPAVYVSGRHIPEVVVTQPSFWRDVARVYETRVAGQGG